MSKEKQRRDLEQVNLPKNITPEKDNGVWDPPLSLQKTHYAPDSDIIVYADTHEQKLESDHSVQCPLYRGKEGSKKSFLLFSLNCRALFKLIGR